MNEFIVFCSVMFTIATFVAWINNININNDIFVNLYPVAVVGLIITLLAVFYPGTCCIIFGVLMALGLGSSGRLNSEGPGSVGAG